MKKLTTLLLTAALVMAMLVPASAASFTPSVEAKEAPTVQGVTASDGTTVDAIIYDATGAEVVGVATGNLIVTPIAQASSADAEISESLTAAYEQIASAASLTEIVPDIASYIPADSGLTVDDLVVRDVFDVTLTGTYADYLAEEGNTITIRFELDLDPSATLIVLHNYSGSDWEVISDDLVVQNADGSVDVTFSSLSPIAFVTDAANVDVSYSETSPTTGESANYALLLFAGVLALAAGACFVTASRKKA